MLRVATREKAGREGYHAKARTPDRAGVGGGLDVGYESEGGGKKEAARSSIPGKNPKTQREEQSGRLVLRRAEDAPVPLGVNGNLCEKSDFFQKFHPGRMARRLR
jgi:hypothetical protein